MHLHSNLTYSISYFGFIIYIGIYLPYFLRCLYMINATTNLIKATNSYDIGEIRIRVGLLGGEHI